MIPKSAQKERIELNADVFDFDLADGDISTLDSLDEGLHFSKFNPLPLPLSPMLASIVL